MNKASEYLSQKNVIRRNLPQQRQGSTCTNLWKYIWFRGVRVCFQHFVASHAVNSKLSIRVSSAVIQRYLHQVLDAALSSNPQIQASAEEILSYTIKQGPEHILPVSTL